MLFNDGTYTIYTIVWQKDTYRNGEWCNANLDKFYVNTPEYEQFQASGECWQRTGVHGVFDPIVAMKVRDQLNEKYPDMDFHVQKVEISQTRTVLTKEQEGKIVYDRFMKGGKPDAFQETVSAGRE